MRISDWSSDGCSSDLVPRMLANIRRADPLMDGHRLGRCKAPILLIRAGAETEGQGSKPVFDWQRHTASEVRSITIDCSHAAMLDDAYASIIAQQIGELACRSRKQHRAAFASRSSSRRTTQP